MEENFNFDVLEKEDENELEEDYAFFQCQNCGSFIDENEPPYKKISEYKVCPFCGKKNIDGKLFKKISKFEFEEAMKFQQKKKKEIQEKEAIKKKKENKQNSLNKVLKDKMKEDIKDLYKELNDDLKMGKISPERYYCLMINLSYNIVKYNSRRMDGISWTDFRKYIVDISKLTLDSYDLKADLDDALDNYEKEKDELYLEYNLKILEGAEDLQSDPYEVEELKKEIRTTEYEIKAQEKLNEKVMKKDKYITDKELKKEEKNFKEILKRQTSK